MNKFDANELKALRRAALALDQSDEEVTRRLEKAYDQITYMLDLIHDRSSTDTLGLVCREIDVLVEKLVDTSTIARLIIRERELEQKLAELDKREETTGRFDLREKLLAMAKDYKESAEAHEAEDEGDPLSADPDTLRRIEERIQLESLVDSLYTSAAAERVKRMLKRESGFKGITRRALIRVPPTTIRERGAVSISRPYRDLDAQVPTSKGEGYELPEIRPSEDRD